jgi:hypothetical protein
MKSAGNLLIILVVLFNSSCSSEDEPGKSNSKKVISFQFLKTQNTQLLQDVVATISNSDKSITLIVPFHISKSALVPAIEISPKSTISPASGEPQNFNSPVTYNVTAEDGSVEEYTITVNSLPAPTISSIEPNAGAFDMEVTIIGTNFSTNVNDNTIKFNGVEGEVLSATENQLTVKVPRGASSGPVSITINEGTLVGPQFKYYDIYMSGSVANEFNQYTPRFWKNGIESALSAIVNYSGYAGAVQVVGDDIYISGQFQSHASPEVDIIGYWKNGDFHTVMTSDPGLYIRTSDMIVIASDVYQSGVHGNEPFENNGGGFPYSARYWKNDNMIKPDPKEFYTVEVYGITVFNDDVYMCGYVLDAGIVIPAYWKNNDLYTIDGFDGMQIWDIEVNDSGIHLLGTSVLGNEPITYWKNGVAQNITTGEFGGFAQSMRLSGDDVYIVGAEGNSSPNSSIAKLWKNGVPENLTNESLKASADRIQIINDSIFILGSLAEGESTRRFYLFNDQMVILPPEFSSVSNFYVKE